MSGNLHDRNYPVLMKQKSVNYHSGNDSGNLMLTAVANRKGARQAPLASIDDGINRAVRKKGPTT